MHITFENRLYYNWQNMSNFLNQSSRQGFRAINQICLLEKLRIRFLTCDIIVKF